MYTVDASVWVNGFDQREPGHAISRQVLDRLGAQAIPIIIPNIVLAEVAGAISRNRSDPAQAQAFATALGNLPNITLVSLDDALARQAVAMAAQHGLRRADSVYAAVAVQFRCTLISLDNEHLTRLAGLVTTRTPAAALTGLTPPATPFP
jgi:predicted nucleic acid-binding protein